MPDAEDDLQFQMILPPDDADIEATRAPRIGRDEMNLAEFPFALLADRVPRGLNTVTFEDSVEGKDGKLVQRLWTVTAGERFGLPLASDEQVYVALMEVTREQGFDQRTIYVTRYDLIKRLGWPDKGDSYRRLRDALDRLLSVTITAKRAFWDNDKKRYVDVGFHIIDDYALYDENPGRKPRSGQDALPLSFITWNQVIFRSFEAGNLKQLDTAFFFSLRSSVSRRLFRYLDKKRYDGKDNFRIRLKKLAFEKLGMSRNYYPSHIKRELQRAHDELIANGFLATVSYQTPPKSDDEQVVYTFARRKHALKPGTLTPEAQAELIEDLCAAGVSRTIAGNLVKDFGVEVRVQLQYLRYRAAEDPAAVLVEAIKRRWEPPASYLKARREEQRRREAAKKQSRQKREEARQRADRQLARDAAWQVYEELAPTVRHEIDQRAEAHVKTTSPALASRVDTIAFRAMRKEHIEQLVREEHAEAFEKMQRQFAKRKIDLDDDL